MSASAFSPHHAPQSAAGRLGQPALSTPGKECQLKVSFVIFFDGTRNNIDEDRSSNSHSNIARLYLTAEENDLSGKFRLYVPGVGTPFPEIGEHTPHRSGASTGAMGFPRITYALLHVANRLAFTASRNILVPQDQIAIAVQDEAAPRDWARRLREMIRGASSPKIVEITFDVFGFSRGATAARSFVNQLQKFFGKRDFCGVKYRIRFMGLFDTVASVGLADSVPMPGVEGHQSWGDQALLKIPPEVEQCVHFVAAHEARCSFPVDLIRHGHAYAKPMPQFIEVIYPGMHSDVGGGYGIKDQGKGTPGKFDGSDRISQIALVDMYRRARAAGVPLMSEEQLKSARIWDQFSICPVMQAHFDRYVQTTAFASQPAEAHLSNHRLLYLAWRKKVIDNKVFEQLPSVRHSSLQDRIDLIESNDELRRYIRGNQLHAGSEWNNLPSLSPDVEHFLERYVHDSRAHFKLLDPQSEWDKQRIRETLESREQLHQRSEHETAVAKRRGTTPTMPRYPALTPRERELLEAYRLPPEVRMAKGKEPTFSDAAPGNHADGIANSMEDLAAIAADTYSQGNTKYISRREGGWNYLSKRQVFAGSRVV